MSQASSATFPVGLSVTHLPIPPKPVFQDFQFKTIGKEPALLMRLSNNTATELDDLDVDDIYEQLPLPSSSIATENVPRTCSRPTLFQTLAGDDELGATDPNDPVTSMDVVNFSSLPASLQSFSSIGVLDTPNLLPNPASPLPILPAGHRLSPNSPGPASQNTACVADSSTKIQHSDPSDRGSSSHPSPNDLVLSPSDQDRRTVDSFKALKKVVVLKDKFRAVSATARQSQRLAKHALINAQRSAAAAQSCLAAAESFVPCVGDVISAIRRMRPGSGPYGPASEWIAVLRDLEDDLYDLKQWSSSFDTSGRDARGQNLPHSRDIHLSPFGKMAQESSSAFPLTSVEAEAQEALRAWNQLDRQIHENNSPAGCGKPRHELGSQRVSPESHLHRAQRLGMEEEKFQHQGIKEARTQVSEEIAEASTGNLDKNGQHHEQAGGRQLVEVEGEAGDGIATEAADAKESQERQDSRDDQMQQLALSEGSHQSPGSRGEETLVVGMAVSSDIRNDTSQKPLADCLQPGSTSLRRDAEHIQATSKPQENVSFTLALRDRDPRNLQDAFATPIAEGSTEQTAAPTSNLVSSDDMQVQTQSMYPPSSAPRSGVDPNNSTSAGHAHPSTPIPTTGSTSEAVRGDGELGKAVIPRSETTPGTKTYDRLRDVGCTSLIKIEPVEPQLSFVVVDNRAADDPLVSNEAKPAFNTALKPDSETPAVSVPSNSSPDACEIGTRLSDRVDLPAPLPNGLPAMKQTALEANISHPSTGPVTSDSGKVIPTPLISPHNVANNEIIAQPTGTPVLSNSPPSPSSHGSQLPPTAQVASAAVHSPTPPSPIPLALRVERPTSSHMRDLDDSIGPDLMFSRGWDADENDGSRRGSRRSPNKFEPVPRSQSRDVESRNQYMDHGSRSMASNPRSHLPSVGGSRVSRSPDGRRPISYEYPAAVTGKKRPRDEVNHPLPPRNRRDWSGAAFPSVSDNQMSHFPQVDINANPRFGPLTTPIAEPGYNSNFCHHSAPSLINRLDPSLESTAQVANPLDRRIQRPFRPQQPPQTQNRPWQNSGYNVAQSHYGHRNHYDHDNDRPPQLLNRMSSSQQIQHGHNAFDSGQSHSNIGRPSNRFHGRGRSFGGQGGAFQQQHPSRKPPSLYDRLDNKP